ncbi:hypothetical protein PR048_028598 [Dryococelus australis]|uniref:Uncharacterized protein n=1 Tax=Dryococelus australis TaxID=614101 RepID=A0ABQ9GDK1_9NEOP|nr:hypothetical protein PR048_028598 [Dryococelus australis]
MERRGMQGRGKREIPEKARTGQRQRPPLLPQARHDGNIEFLACRGDESLGERGTVARIAPLLLDLERAQRYWGFSLHEVLRADEGEVRMEQYRNSRTGETGDAREISPTRGIVRHDFHLRTSGVTWPGNKPGSSWWEASSLTAQPSQPQLGSNKPLTEEARQASVKRNNVYKKVNKQDRLKEDSAWRTLELIAAGPPVY